MGLMYIFPVSTEETDRTEIISDTSTGKRVLILKTYGLPMVFWAYLGASLIVVFSMWLASKATITKLLSYDDSSMQALGYLVSATLILTPVILLGFFFYEKNLVKSGDKLKLLFKVFFIPVFSKTISLDAPDALFVEHFMDSPNMAKIYNKTELRGFENKGYFELRALSNGKKLLIDRHTRKADLEKIRNLLSQY
jgi:hypothetical protein